MKWYTIPKTKFNCFLLRSQRCIFTFLASLHQPLISPACLLFSTYSLFSYSLRYTYQDEPFNLHSPACVKLCTFSTVKPHFTAWSLYAYRSEGFEQTRYSHILQGGPSHRHTVKSCRWLHKWKMAEVKCFQQPKYVLWTKHGRRRLPDITQTVRQDLNQRLRNSGLWIQPSVLCFILIHILAGQLQFQDQNIQFKARMRLMTSLKG